MKKLLGSSLALAMVLPAGVNAEMLKNLKISGQLDVQATSANNVTDMQTRSNANANDRIGSVMTRTMLSADWDLLDDVHSRVTLSKGDSSNGTTRAYGSGAENLNTVQSNVVVVEANVKIDKLFGAIDTTIGRQFYGETGDLVIYYGPRNNYGQGVQALDAFRFDWNSEHVGVTGLASKVSGGSIATAPTDVDVRGLVATIKGFEKHQESVYLYNRVNHSPNQQGAANGLNDNLWVLGAKTKLTFGGLMAKAEIAKNFGENRTTFGTGNNANYTGSDVVGS